MRQLIEKGLEWGGCFTVAVLEGDIHKAYDYTDHQKFLRAACKKGLPTILTAAW